MRLVETRDIEHLLVEAQCIGDDLTTECCRRALSGDSTAWEECADIIISEMDLCDDSAHYWEDEDL